MSDGVVLRKGAYEGATWKIWTRVKKGLDPVQIAAKWRAERKFEVM